MGRSPYQSEKRRKELARLKKQEEKRLRRQNKKTVDGADGDNLAAIPTVQFGLDGLPIEPESDDQAAEGSEESDDAAEKDPGTGTPS